MKLAERGTRFFHTVVGLQLYSAKGAIDRTKYGHSRVSTKSFYTHHTQRISTAVVRYDAQNIREQSAQLIRRALLLDVDAGAA